MKANDTGYKISRQRGRTKSVLWVFAAAFCALGWSAPAHAYIDGGTASMIFQLTIAGALGAAVVVKSYWIRIKAFFFSSFGKGQEDSSAEK